ncbi:MAG TPA: carboxy terminal-processing peptidase, partial [Ignavibacteriaceae bacterium]|nr:carboxy terminal-processing peptidase [Ignavibacteriaceae bacterium]
DEFGESSQTNALPWDQIDPTDYNMYADLAEIIPNLQEKHLNRMNDNIEYQQMLADIQEYRANRNTSRYSLNLTERQREKQEAEDRKFERENELRKAKGLKLLEKGELSEEKDDEKDFILKESANILADFILQKIG